MKVAHFSNKNQTNQVATATLATFGFGATSSHFVLGNAINLQRPVPWSQQTQFLYRNNLYHTQLIRREDSTIFLRHGNYAQLCVSSTPMSSNLAQLLTLPSLDQVRALSSDDFDAMNILIERELRSDVPLVREIAHYIVQSGGKRLRPLIVLLVARTCSYSGTDHIKLAALVEFLHTATLLHDDVVDKSARRRNRRSANAIWGNSASVLVGDFLYSRAFELMVEINSMGLMEIISEATNAIAEGEVLQLQNIGNTSLSEIEYMDIIRRKTAMLFQAAAHTGAVLAGAHTNETKLFQDFGLHFGLAFQLIDDWLDYAGTSDSMGKNVGDDLSEGKATLPLIYAMTHGSKAEAKTIKDAINSQSAEGMNEVIRAVRSSGALDYVRERAQQQTDWCLDCLESLPANPFRHGLEALANVALCRMS